MTWMAKLYETYQQGLNLDVSSEQQLMPISHTLQNAHINIVVSATGEFLRAKVLEKTQVVLPATEKSAGRSSGEAPHPLADKLQYVAGDYADFGGLKKHYFEGYIHQLNEWANSNFSCPQVRAIESYIEKKSVIRDLIEAGICHVDEHSVLLTEWQGSQDDIPRLFKVLPKEKGLLDQGNALVCWSVDIAGELDFDTWNSQKIQGLWVAYDAQSSSEERFCMVSGETKAMASNHPAKLRHTGDKAKLISANDKDGFTFKGRFLEGEEAASVSYEVTQKAHNALRWLIGQRKQAYRTEEQVVVTWAVSGKVPPQPLDDDLSDLFDDSITPSDSESKTNLHVKQDVTVAMGQQFSQALQSYMKGYYQNFSDLDTDSIMVMGLDSATPGRMAITYYRDFHAHHFLQTIEQWHKHFAWPQRVKREKDSSVRWLPFAPTPYSIMNVCYGDILEGNKELKKQVIERLIPCIVEGRPLPRDLMNQAVKRASNPNSGEYWEWEKSLGVACALFRGFHHPARQPNSMNRRNFSMSLDKSNTSRDYLYGRLLAYAEKIELVALSLTDTTRPTTSQRLMQRFSDRPSSTWLTITKQLDPYMRQLRVSRTRFIGNCEKEIDLIVDAFQNDSFINDKPLSGEFLLGFHSQRLDLRANTNATDHNKESTDLETNIEE